MNPDSDIASRRELQTWDRGALERYQLERLNLLLDRVLRDNAFYRERYGTDQLQLSSLAELSRLPFMSKSDWINTEATGIAKHHSYGIDQYRRYHRTSGTRGRPMVIMDTDSDWKWWVSTWQYVLDACQITRRDRVLMAFSFGPFIGFWSAHDACLSRECMVIPSGGMSTMARIELIESSRPTVLFSTPSYALHLGQAAEKHGKSLRDSSIRCVFVAGEPGGSVPSIRSSIESMYGAEVMDHVGATEIGPWGFGSSDGHFMHVIESEFIAEYLPVNLSSAQRDALRGLIPSHASVPVDVVSRVSELVLTSLGRVGAPVLRYRTGDLVCPITDPNRASAVRSTSVNRGDNVEEEGANPLAESCFVRLAGGVLGRADDMIVVRGVNVFPSSVEAIIREFPEVGEYRLVLFRSGAMDELQLEVEDGLHDPTRIAERLLLQLQLRVDVVDVPGGTLSKSEGKSRRVVDRR
ncbi:MAG: phenylacetate--CoA ligase [Planctomycetes bacterium]|nr:phenylacetate--CoA ligase [Planctomycetota bacterium]